MFQSICTTTVSFTGIIDFHITTFSYLFIPKELPCWLFNLAKMYLSLQDFWQIKYLITNRYKSFVYFVALGASIAPLNFSLWDSADVSAVP